MQAQNVAKGLRGRLSAERRLVAARRRMAVLDRRLDEQIDARDHTITLMRQWMRDARLADGRPAIDHFHDWSLALARSTRPGR